MREFPKELPQWIGWWKLVWEISRSLSEKCGGEALMNGEKW